MTAPGKYSIGLEEVVDSARVPLDQQVEEQDVGDHSEDDEAAGHLPGNVRPYGA